MPRNTRNTRRSRRLALALAVVVGGWLAQQAGIDLGAPGKAFHGGSGAAAPSAGGLPAVAERAVGAAEERIEEAFASRASGFMITLEARVVKRLRDDLDGSRHQRFLIELDSGRTLLVAHNIDLARRAPLAEGDRVRVRGQYEWNDRGGVLHWTHHDPAGRHPGGWVEVDGVRVE